MKPTKTINKLHPEDLSFSRFEDMCVQIVYRMKNWSSIQHFGRKGKERGVDIHSEIIEDEITRRWVTQCKKYKSLSLSQIKKVIDEFIAKNNELPDNYLLIAACDISRDDYGGFKNYAAEKGLEKVDFIGASILETILYAKHPDILYTFFDVSVLNKRTATVARIKRRLSMKRKIERGFAGKRNAINVIIRDVHRDIYPDQELDTLGISPWFKLEYSRLYHRGISLYTAVVSVAIHTTGRWRLCEYDEKLEKGWARINALQIGNIPYDNVVDIDLEGDEYYPFPHLYCEFNNLGEPYEEIWYEPTDDYKKVILRLDSEMMINKQR